MGIAAIKLKIMPSSPQADLKKLIEKAEKKITELKGKVSKTETVPIAFGLNAIFITIAWPEEQDNEILETELANIGDISSVQIIDFRRAFG